MTAPESRSSPPPRPNGGSNGENGAPHDPVGAPRAEPTIPQEILDEEAWLLRVARGLTDDVHLAEDVVQNAYLAALRSPPRDPRRRRGWLRTVVKNFVRLAHRESSRRIAREKVIARPEATPSAEGLVEEAELRSLVAATVAELAEPYRSTVIEHFYRGRSSKEIALEEGVAPNTVRVRIRRALIQLTNSLDRRCAGRRAVWLLPLLGLFLPADRLLALQEERGLLTETGGGGRASGREATGAPRALAPIALIAVLLTGVVWLDSGRSRGAGEPSRVDAATPAGMPGGGRTLAGEDRTGTAGAEVVARRPGAIALPADIPRVVRAVDRETGEAIAGAEVYLDPPSMPSERLARGRTPLEWLTQPFATRLAGRTDAEGRLALPPTRLGRDRLLVRAPGYAEYRERANLRRGTEDGILEISLRRAESGGLTVLLPEGGPAAAIPVRIVGAHGAGHEGRTDRDGRLEYPLEDSEHRVEIDFEGFAPVRTLALPPDQTISLVRAPVQVLRLIDRRQRAVGGARVTIERPDRTRVDHLSDEFGRVRISAVAGGAPLRLVVEHPEHPRTVLERGPDQNDAIELADAAWIEGIVTGPSGAVGEGLVLAVPASTFFARDLPRAAIDGTGHFRLGPLPPGSTTVRIESSGLAPLEMTVAGLIENEVRPVSPVLSRGRSLTARIVTSDGDPLPGVRIQVGAVFGDEVRGPIVESDAEGIARIDDLPLEDPPLRVTIPETRWTAFGDPKNGFADGPTHGLILQVHAPHQLHAADGVELPRLFFLGSRNTVALDPDRELVELIVDPWPERSLPRVELIDPEGHPVRDVVNWLILPPEDPTDRSRIFAGTDGNPVNVHDAAVLDGCWIGLTTRRHAITGRVLRLDGDNGPWFVELWPRVERTLVFRHDDGSPRAGAELWWVPEGDDEIGAAPAFAALALGRTDAEGALSVDFLAPGSYRVVESLPRTEVPQPGLDAIAFEPGGVIGVFEIPRIGGSRLEVRVRRGPEVDGDER